MLAKIFGLILSFLTLFIGAVPEVEPMNVPAADDFSPVLRFVVSSDSHIKENGDDGCQKIMKMIKTGAAAGENTDHPALDAAVMVGDITNTGFPHTFAEFRASVNKVLPEETDFLCVAAKNHDSYLGRVSRCYVSAVSGDPADFHKVINGFHFIGLSASPLLSQHYTDKQLNWLDEQLAQATADDPAKPVFVFQHEHIKDTVYGSLPGDGWGVEFFTDILSKYPQVIDISGHSHYPANDPRSIWQGEFTAINDGGLSYYEFTIDGSNSQHPESSDNMAHMLLVEVDGQNRVKVRVCDMTCDAVLAEYMIDNVSEVNKTKYSHETRRAAAEAPVFESEPAVSVSDSGVKITCAPAVPGDEDVVFIYRLEITAADGSSAASQKKLGDYYKTGECGNVEFSVSGLAAGEYTAKLTAEDAWGKASEPVKCEFTVK